MTRVPMLPILPAVLLLIVPAATAAPLWVGSDDQSDDAASYATYVTVDLTHCSIGGDHFDGRTYYYPESTDLCAVPEVDGAAGFRVGVGVRRVHAPFHALGASYSQSSHEGSWYWMSKGVESRTLLLEGKLFMGQPPGIQPYFVAGAGMRWLRVEDGHYHDSESQVFVADTTLWGLGGKIGAGAEYPVSPHVVLCAGADFEVFSLSQVASEGPGLRGMSVVGLLQLGVSLSAGVGVNLAF
jgi:hypothetical protein